MKRRCLFFAAALLLGLVSCKSTPRDESGLPAEGSNAAGGREMNYDVIRIVERMPTVQEFREAAKYVGSDILDEFSDAELDRMIKVRESMSFPDDRIYTAVRFDIATTAHELEHQRQYQMIGKKEVFEALVREALTWDTGGGR